MDEEVGVFGNEHSSARLISEAQIAEFWSYSFRLSKLRPNNRLTHDSTHHTLLYGALY